jgi:PrtD family type I secretion system ABC transporter
MAPSLSAACAARGERVRSEQALASDRAGLCLAMSRVLRLGLQIVMLAVAATFVIHDQLTAGAMMATSILLGRALAPVEQAVGIWRQLIDARLSFRRLRAVLQRGGAEPQGVPMPLPRPLGTLSVEQLGYSAPGAREPLLRGLSFALAPGEMLGVIGPSGAGKTTFARLLVGLAAPQAGAVRLDGVDVHAWDAVDLGRHVGYVPQSVELVPGTVHANIARFTEAPAEAVIAAARAAGIHELVLRLPQGYDTIIGGPHDMLSAGTRQRLAFARALFGDPAFLVLDEPYSNLDASGLQAFMAALKAAKARAVTTVVIAHRPSVLAAADKVLLIEGGNARLIDRARRTKLSVVAAPETTTQRTVATPRRPPMPAKAAEAAAAGAHGAAE